MPEQTSQPKSPHGLPLLLTERLRLVPYGLAPATVEAFCRVTTDPAIYWWRETPYTEQQQTDYFESGALFEDAPRGLGAWAAFARDEDVQLGHVMLQPLDDAGMIEIGWHLLETARGHGYATEAAAALFVYGFDVLNIDPIYAVILPSNETSIQVAKRIGMQPDGEGTYHDDHHLRFRLTRNLHDTQLQD